MIRNYRHSRLNINEIKKDCHYRHLRHYVVAVGTIVTIKEEKVGGKKDV